jgi:hypothetical protein
MDFFAYRVLFEDILDYVQYLKETKDPVQDFVLGDILPDLSRSITCSDRIINTGKALMQCIFFLSLCISGQKEIDEPIPQVNFKNLKNCYCDNYSSTWIVVSFTDSTPFWDMSRSANVLISAPSPCTKITSRQRSWVTCEWSDALMMA